MIRRKETRPTSIYWLVDNRHSVPFYCGKTVLSLDHRLACHKREAAKGTRRVHVKMRDCGNSVSIHQVELVPIEGDWSVREKRWIFLLRHMNPDCCNTADGGAGATGRIVTAEQRAVLSAMFKGKSTHTPEVRAKLSAIGTGRKRTAESVAKSAAGLKGRKQSPEHVAKVVAANKGKKRKPMGPRTAEDRAKISRGNAGKVRTPEMRANIRAARLAYLAKIAAAPPQ